LNNWFEVDVKGLRALQEGKDKTFIIRELVQNCWDENIKNCVLKISLLKDNIIKVFVSDDSPEGFRNLKDAYTLFGDTTKRRDAEKRGRYNFGEKQLISVCKKAVITTTKGAVVFNDNGRFEHPEKTEKGTIVEIEIDGNKNDYDEMIDYAKTLLVPKNINYFVNEEKIFYKEPIKSFETVLMTEIDEKGFLKKVRRKTRVNVMSTNNPEVYELGIPVMDIDCKFGIDIMQKVPLSFDRDSVNQTFLKELYSEVLNNVYDLLDGDSVSDSWVRLAMRGTVSKEAASHVMNTRYGDKYVSANPFDPKSVFEAIANGYRVITGSEMSREEWGNVKDNGLIQSSSDLFGTTYENAPVMVPDDKQMIFASYAKRVAKRILGFDINVVFVNGSYSSALAQYGNRELTVNVTKAGKEFFKNPVSVTTTDLLIHELGHENGTHIEESYHQLLTKLGAELIFLALKEPQFFKEGN
jgi:hypothetical protein